tara:strand:- start:656 stop:838 length:183 start_codon:yes stop_codon:yes gene_type:complete
MPRRQWIMHKILGLRTIGPKFMCNYANNGKNSSKIAVIYQVDEFPRSVIIVVLIRRNNYV